MRDFSYFSIFNLCDKKRDVIKNEINLMRMLNHPHIVKYYGEFVYSDNFQCILMELCEVNDTLTLIEK